MAKASSKAEGALSNSESSLIDAYWRAANYLSVGQIYCSTIPCCVILSRRSTSSRVSWGTGAQRPALTSSTRTSIG
jgi:phosphoketolase